MSKAAGAGPSAEGGVGARADAALRRSFARGAVLCLVGLLAAAFGIHLLSAGRHRPEGVAERWLTAVSGTTRKGVEADARRRAAAIGDPALAATLLPSDPEDKNAFEDLEVGKARSTGEGVPAGGVAVPFQLHPHEASGVKVTKGGRIELVRRAGGSGWTVVGVAVETGEARVPSNGYPPPSRAPSSLWVVAVLGGVLLTALTSVLVRWAGRAEERLAPQ